MCPRLDQILVSRRENQSLVYHSAGVFPLSVFPPAGREGVEFLCCQNGGIQMSPCAPVTVIGNSGCLQQNNQISNPELFIMDTTGLAHLTLHKTLLHIFSSYQRSAIW